jgi:hypothetical protein
MTEKLKDLLQARAEAVDFAVPDVDALTRDGDRRRARRRAAVIGGAAAVVLVAGTAAVVVPGLGGDDAPGPAGRSSAGTPDLSWVSGQTLYAPDLPGGEIDLGHEVSAYVRTHDGFVLADPDGHVWSWTDGEETEVGTVDARDPHLVSDPSGSLAGWLDAGNGKPAYVVLDQATGDTTTYDDQAAGATTPAGPGSSPYFYAIDGDTAYWRDARGAVATDLGSGEATVVDSPAGSDLDITAVHDGVVAFNSADGTTIGSSPQDALRLKGSFGGRGSFSPDGRYFSEDADEPKVWDMTTGDRVELDLQFNFASGYGWTDDGDLLVLGQDGWQDELEITRCQVPGGDCATVQPDLGTFSQLDKHHFALPVGSRVGG